MGWSLTGLRFEYVGTVEVVADGNNAAWTCPVCSRPLLFIYQRGRVGSGPETPSVCACGASYFLDPPFAQQQEPPRGETAAPATPMRILRTP
jgi:hypothetical protein